MHLTACVGGVVKYPVYAVVLFLVLVKLRNLLLGDEKTNWPGLPRDSTDQSILFQSQDHLVNRGSCHAEVHLHVAFGRGLVMDLGIAVDEREILSLFGRELHIIFSNRTNTILVLCEHI